MLLLRALSPLVLVFCLAGCGIDPSPEIAEQGGQPIECSLDGKADFADACMIAVTQGEESFVIRHPDGGFRRFISDGRGGWQMADGAAPLEIAREPAGSSFQFTVENDRYLVPVSQLPRQVTGG